MKLRELLMTYSTKSQEVNLYDWDCDRESAIMVDLSMKDFTKAGLEAFKDVLDADVVRVTPTGENEVSVFVKGVHHSRIENFSLAHAGYCSEENYDEWFTMGAR